MWKIHLAVVGLLLAAGPCLAQSVPKNCKYGFEPGGGTARCADPDDPNSYLYSESQKIPSTVLSGRPYYAYADVPTIDAKGRPVADQSANNRRMVSALSGKKDGNGRRSMCRWKSKAPCVGIPDSATKLICGAAWWSSMTLPHLWWRISQTAAESAAPMNLSPISKSRRRSRRNDPRVVPIAG